MTKYQVCSVRDQDPAANSLMEQISDLEEEEYDNRWKLHWKAIFLFIKTYFHLLSYKSEHAGRHEIREIETVL